MRCGIRIRKYWNFLVKSLISSSDINYSNVKTSKDTTQPRSGRRGGRGNGTGATRGRGGNSAGGANSTLIQTQGLFSEGAGDVHVRRSTGNGTAYARGGEEVAVARKRVDRKDDKSQAERIKELLGESEASDAELSEEEPTKTEMALRPILLKEGTCCVHLIIHLLWEKSVAFLIWLFETLDLNLNL